MPNTFHSGTQGFALGSTPELPFSPHRSPHSFLLHFLGVSSNDTKQRGFLCIPCIKQPPPLSGGSDCKESACSVGDLGSIPGLGRSPGEGNGYPFQYSGLEKSMDREALWAIVRGVTRSLTEHQVQQQNSIPFTWLYFPWSLYFTDRLRPHTLICLWPVHTTPHTSPMSAGTVTVHPCIPVLRSEPSQRRCGT